MNPVQVIAVIDDETNYEALYVDGDLKESDMNIYMGDVATCTKGLVIEFRQVVVSLPDGVEFPARSEDLLKFVVDDNE